MKDLYRRNGLAPYESDRGKITNCVAVEHSDHEACFAILLDQERKQEYDAVHRTLTAIAVARRHCEVKNERWDKQNADFYPHVESSAQGRTANKSKKSSDKKNNIDPNAAKGISATLIVLLLIAGFILVKVFVPGAAVLNEPYAEAKNMHVKSDTAFVYREMNEKSAPIAKLDKYDEVKISAESNDGKWLYGKGEYDEGYILYANLTEGKVEASILDDCRAAGIQRPESSVLKSFGAMGKNILLLANPPGKDAVVKLKDNDGVTAFIIYMRADSKLRVEGVAEGAHFIEYAIGNNFSPSCALFVDDLQIVRDPKTFQFVTSVMSEKAYPARLSYMLKSEIFDVTPVAIKRF